MLPKTTTKKKKAQKKKVVAKLEPLAPARYIEAVGRRKTAVARVRLYPGSAGVSVNERTIETYFPWLTLQETALAPLKRAAQDAKYKITAKISGGGIRAQAEALRLGISRALVKERAELRPVLKKLDFLKRDPRMKERKKYGLKAARRAPQWAKR